MSILEALYAIIASYFKANQIEIYSQVAKVTKVDKSEYSCEIELLRGGKRKHARITATLDNGSGIVVFPKQDSNVIVSFIDQTTVFIAKYSEIDEIIFFEGKNDGLVMIKELKDNLDSLKNYVETMNMALPAAFSAVGAAMGAVGANGANSYQTAMSTQKITFKDMENKKIKQ